MSVFFVSHSALSFWRLQRTAQRFNPKSVRVLSSNEKPADTKVVRQAAHLCLPENSPIHIAVPKGSSRNRVAGIHRHQCSFFHDSSTRMEIFDGVYVSTPESTFVTMCGSLSFERAVLLGFELCGSYSLLPDGTVGFVSCQPLLNIQAIQKYLERYTSARHSAKAASAARFILAGAASPREAITALLLTLPPRYGGYGLPKPLLNSPIQLSHEQQCQFGQSSIRPDLLWPDYKVALEYDSHAWHSDNQAYVRDSRRRNMLGSIGIECITVTNAELKNLYSIDAIATSLSKRFKRRTSSFSPKFRDNQRQLRTNLGITH